RRRAGSAHWRGWIPPWRAAWAALAVVLLGIVAVPAMRLEARTAWCSSRACSRPLPAPRTVWSGHEHVLPGARAGGPGPRPPGGGAPPARDRARKTRWRSRRYGGRATATRPRRGCDARGLPRTPGRAGPGPLAPGGKSHPGDVRRGLGWGGRASCEPPPPDVV